MAKAGKAKQKVVVLSEIQRSAVDSILMAKGLAQEKVDVIVARVKEMQGEVVRLQSTFNDKWNGLMKTLSDATGIGVPRIELVFNDNNEPISIKELPKPKKAKAPAGAKAKKNTGTKSQKKKIKRKKRSA